MAAAAAKRRAPLLSAAMRAAALVAPRRIELVELPRPELGPHDVRVAPAAVGVCGTDLHIWNGESNFHLDALGVPVPLDVAPQVLGHEIAGTVIEVGASVLDVHSGERVVVDQGRNCRSARREPECEFCQTGDSHQCEHYVEHGITGLPGGFADELVVPAVNAVRIDSDLELTAAALTEPLACGLHARDAAGRARTRDAIGADDPAARVRTAVVLGAGPAGLLFVQALRAVLRFDGVLIVSDPSPEKRALATALGADACAPEELLDAVRARSRGRRAELLVEASGAGPAFAALPALARKQATVVGYGIGHGGASLELLNPVKWRELGLVLTVGASGGFDADGRPSVYRRALALLERGTVDVRPLVTHLHHGLAEIPRAFTAERGPGHVKDVVVL
jgi:L-iditol 2-dehydrogenase